MNLWKRVFTSSRRTGCLLVLAGLCVLVWGLHARLRQYHLPTASLAASFMLLDQNDRGGVVVTEGERFRSPIQNESASGVTAVVDLNAFAPPGRIRTSEAARLPIPPTQHKLLMRPPPAARCWAALSAAL